MSNAPGRVRSLSLPCQHTFDHPVRPKAARRVHLVIDAVGTAWIFSIVLVGGGYQIKDALGAIHTYNRVLFRMNDEGRHSDIVKLIRDAHLGGHTGTNLQIRLIKFS